MYKWNSISGKIRAESEAEKPKRDRMRLARHYQSLLDSGECESRAALARHLGVSRARVTQVLKRLVTENQRTASLVVLAKLDRYVNPFSFFDAFKRWTVLNQLLACVDD